MIFNDVNLDDFICDQVNNLESDNYQAFKGFADIVPNLDRFLKKALKSSYSEDVFINKDYFKTCFLMAVKLYDGIAVSLNDQYKRYDLEYNQSFVDKLNRFSKLVFKLDSNPNGKKVDMTLFRGMIGSFT